MTATDRLRAQLEQTDTCENCHTEPDTNALVPCDWCDAVYEMAEAAREVLAEVERLQRFHDAVVGPLGVTGEEGDAAVLVLLQSDLAGNAVCEAEHQDYPECAICNAPATCLGRYECSPLAYACDTCCGHGCEDGECAPLSEAPAMVQKWLDVWKRADEESYEKNKALQYEVKQLRAEVAHLKSPAGVREMAGIRVAWAEAQKEGGSKVYTLEPVGLLSGDPLIEDLRYLEANGYTVDLSTLSPDIRAQLVSEHEPDLAEGST